MAIDFEYGFGFALNSLLHTHALSIDPAATSCFRSWQWRLWRALANYHVAI
jgi:hypothetical protein